MTLSSSLSLNNVLNQGRSSVVHPTMTPGEELAQLAASQKPVKLRGSGLAFLCVSVVGLFFSLLAVGLRIWSRAWLSRRAKLWGWDDTLSVLSLV